MPSKTPERHDPQDHTIQFDVPYIYMKDRNDCWKAALSMLYQFVDLELDTNEFPEGWERNGIARAQANTLLPKYLQSHPEAPQSALEYYTFLHAHGPALVVLPDNDQADHAQVLTGISGGEVLLNNPAEDPRKQDLSVQTSGNAVARLHR